MMSASVLLHTGRTAAGSGRQQTQPMKKLLLLSMSRSARSLSRASTSPTFRAKSHPHFKQQQRWYSSSTAVLKDYPPHTVYTMPALSPTMEVGTITAWHVKEGDAFEANQSLCTVETDKASVDFDAQDDGVLAKIIRQGENAVDLPVQTPICVVVEDAASVAAFADFALEQNPAQAAAAAATPATSAPAAPRSSGPSILFPSARHLAESSGFDATILSGSGKDGRVTKGDVMEAMAAGTLPALPKKTSTIASPTAAKPAPAPVAPIPAAAPAPVSLAELILPIIEAQPGTFEDVPNSKMRKIIAKRLTESKSQVPHFYTSVQVELDAILALRKQLAKTHQVNVSVNDFVIRCSALALRDVPQVKGTYNPATNTMHLSDTIDISVAVATPTGLITPIVFGTDKLGLSEITTVIRDLALRAREGKLMPHEFQGGTFSVSNLGMFGIQEFSAVINPPQAAILAVGGGSRCVVPTPYQPDAEQQLPPSIKTIMTACLSADRRVVDEATAGVFVSALRHFMNQPELLML